MAYVKNSIMLGSGGGGTTITVVANYSALPDPTTVTGQFYWAEASQGTAWLPGSLGGTYYNSGMYYSNGVSWSFVNVPYQATQAEVNAEVNTDKFVTPNTLGGWWTNIKTLAQTISGIWTWANGVIFSAISNPSYAKGLVFYDNNSESLAYYDDISGTTNNINYEQTLRARNNTGSTITNGSVVYINGALGQNPTIALAKADSITTCEVIGMATHDIPNNTVGKVTTFGLVNDLDTSAFSDGAVIYVSASTAGLITSTVPSSPNFNAFVGVIAHSHVTQGKIFIHPASPISLNTTLGTSNLFPVSENVVKSYTDAKVADAINDGVTTIAPSQNAVFDALALKEAKPDYMKLTSAYTLASSTSLQKAFNVGSSSGGAYNAEANRTIRFKTQLLLNSLSTSSGDVSFGILGTAGIASILYTSIGRKATTLSASASVLSASIASASIASVTASNAAPNAHLEIEGTIVTSTAGTLILAIATGVATGSASVAVNSFARFDDIGADTFTASSNIS